MERAIGGGINVSSRKRRAARWAPPGGRKLRPAVPSLTQTTCSNRGQPRPYPRLSAGGAADGAARRKPLSKSGPSKAPPRPWKR
ncbi:MAG: hypothetical protein WKG07_12195 [Hymenobacter sp.]